MRENQQDAVDRGKIFFKFLFKKKNEVTEEEVKYFRKHPDEIDAVTAPINIHKLFLAIGIGLGVLLVGLSKVIAHSSFLPVVSELFREIIIDIVFEIGVALIGAGVTAYMLGILLNIQQDNARQWRQTLRKRIDIKDGAEN